jgi:hypothetical protein
MKHKLIRLLGVTVALSPVLAFGQAYERVAPKTLPENPPVTVPEPAQAPPPLPPSDQVVLPALKGLVFIPDPAALHKEGLPGATGISAPGLPLLADPAFTAKLSPFLGQKLTLADIDKIATLVTDRYKDHDQPFMAVTVPPQNITSGVVQVVVSQYRIGVVKPEDNNWFSSDLLVRESGLQPGQTLTLSGVQDGLRSWPDRCHPEDRGSPAAAGLRRVRQCRHRQSGAWRMEHRRGLGQSLRARPADFVSVHPLPGLALQRARAQLERAAAVERHSGHIRLLRGGTTRSRPRLRRDRQ